MEAAMENKRGYFRVNDSVALVIRLLRDEAASSLNELFDERRRDFSIVNEFLLARERYLPKLVRIRRRDPDIAEYIDYLEDKIQKLAAAMGREQALKKAVPTHHVNLSASGIRFHSDTPLAEGEKVELTITLFPSGVPVLVFGDVIRATPGEGESWSYVVKFTHIHDDDMETLIKHIHARQLDDLRLKAL